MAEKVFNTRIKQKCDTLANFRSTNEVYLKNELLFAQDDEDISIYLGDGVTAFNDLKEIYSSKWVLGRNEIQLEPVQLLPENWTTNKTQTVSVPGINPVESEQLIIPTYSAGTREIAMSCGVDYVVTSDGKLEFRANKVPTEMILVYIGMLGKKTEGSDDKPVIRTDIDTSLSTESTNPVENRVITAKINSIESTINSITGDGSGSGDTASLSSLDTKLTNATTYKLGQKIKIGTYNDEDNYRQLVDYSLYVSSEVMEPNSDLGMIEVTGPKVTFTKLNQAYWCGTTASGDFFGNFPVRVTSDKKVHLVNVPVSTEQYYMEGYIVFEGNDFSITGV